MTGSQCFFKAFLHKHTQRKTSLRDTEIILLLLFKFLLKVSSRYLEKAGFSSLPIEEMCSYPPYDNFSDSICRVHEWIARKVKSQERTAVTLRKNLSPREHRGSTIPSVMLCLIHVQLQITFKTLTDPVAMTALTHVDSSFQFTEHLPLISNLFFPKTCEVGCRQAHHSHFTGEKVKAQSSSAYHLRSGISLAPKQGSFLWTIAPLKSTVLRNVDQLHLLLFDITEIVLPKQT